ncbi:HNH endonuclease signature motif containing protein [Brachybacterium sacelli]|uniref:HNH endonuclease n=1 Tax=Brachybacterium sacelli TaxID=173364 RepID=A0ABS4X703_9MICO|nr:HNH endonuclease signature motif containing protein [Brachybacterium sacelli]MBP2384038.1 hypothetical protein [Brachybacterium sacelli]
MSAIACGTASEGDDPQEDFDPSDLAFLASLPRRLRQVTARTPLTREGLPDRGESSEDPRLSAAAQLVWDAEKDSARALASRYRAVAALHDCEADGEEPADEDDLDTRRAALALRVTDGVAAWELRSAHQAVDQFPRTLGLLESGHFPSWWFTRMLRAAQKLSDDSRRQIDLAIAAWSTDITAERFVSLLNALVQLRALREKEAEQEPAEPVRTVELAPDTAEGIGTITFRGPIPEILAFWKRLDESAHAVQAAQRKALREGTEIPFDLEETVSRTGRPVPLDRLRYALQFDSSFDTDGVQVPVERFRLNLTVPALTLLGASDAPGMVEGSTPIPPRMARSLAGAATTWYRVLTDPGTGAFLPCPAEKYHPDKAMLEHLRLRNSTCAVPGCTRSTSWASEGDHIEEYDHADPTRGGLTEIENLHLLCWQHHLEKTLGLLDPARLVRNGSGPGRTRWSIGSHDQVITTDDVDVATRIAVRQLERIWELHERRKNARRPLPPPEEPPTDTQEVPPTPDDPPPF